MPFLVHRPQTAYKVQWRNGATINGNIDMGVYDEVGNRLSAIGGVAQTGAGLRQITDITDVLLRPGLYYLAMAVDNITATFLTCAAFNSGVNLRMAGVRQQASAYPLPATATFADSTGVLIIRCALYFHSQLS